MISPQATLEKPPRTQPKSAPLRSGGSPSLRCFLVEDNAVIRHNLIATLEEMLTVDVIGTAADEPEALRWMASSAGRDCDLLIIDLFLKEGSGFGVLANAREKLPSVHLVVLSNYATPDIRSRCLALGAERVFDKSAELEDLLDHCGALGARPR